MADGKPSVQALKADAQALYDSGKDLNSIPEAQEAARRSARLHYYTLEILADILSKLPK